MPFWLVDDDESGNPAFMALSDRARTVLHACRCSAARYLTAGVVDNVKLMFRYSTAAVAELVTHGWLEHRGGPTYYLAGWTERQRSRAQVQAEREKNKERQAAWRGRHPKPHNDVSHGPHNGVTDATVTGTQAQARSLKALQRTDDRSTEATVAAFKAGWARLPRGVFPMPTDADFIEAAAVFTVDQFDEILINLSTSKCVDRERFGIDREVPTLRELLSRQRGRDDIAKGGMWHDKHAAPRCGTCRQPVHGTRDCPPLPPCGMYHNPQYDYCVTCKRLEFEAERRAASEASA